MTSPTFLDANAIIYALDKTSEFYNQAVATIQRLLLDGGELCTSHHVVEEVIYIAVKSSGGKTKPLAVVREISKIPGLILVEPDADMDFARRYASLAEKLNLGVNDALILQLMIDAGIKNLFSFDKNLINAAAKCKIASES